MVDESPAATSSCRRRSRRCSLHGSTSSTAERGVLERGAVEGKIFHRGGVQALSGESATCPSG